MDKKTYLQKAKIQYEAALCLFKNGYINDAISRLYYSFRSLCVHIVGKPEKGKWKHYSLMKKVIIIVDNYDKNILSRKDRELIKNFPNLRETADYDLLEIPKEKFNIYLEVVDKFFRFMEKMELEDENFRNDNQT
ncbi:hypothetical protein [Persephonella sp. KM09-Lau-8]|uniref:hypothetical protein n=1 Tax=Persephonella sp. KM09-Lau-8 TaxID=1158345 RepID=UPI00049626D4|nr:hypothetical protein [Persephonella sp. KM09-Lau-8]